jgi:beta-glucosidase-like glycosyl hydrolase
VQARRYFRNPHDWPVDPVQQFNRLCEIMKKDYLENYLEQIVEIQGYYPLLPSNEVVASMAVKDQAAAEAVAYATGAITGRALGVLGIDTLYAPVCDLSAQAFPERCYGDKVDIVIACATQWGLGAATQKGIERICLKHAPGHGVKINNGMEGLQDTHNKRCVSTGSLAELTHHMQVFTAVVQQLIAQGVRENRLSVMTNHITMNAIDTDAPVSSSEKATAFIRTHLPTGIALVADCINMAGFAEDMDEFNKRLDLTCALHDGGVIATTHYVKRTRRKDLIEIYNKVLPCE